MSLITVARLQGATPKNLLRLARALKLDTDNMDHEQVVQLVYWSITRPVVRFADPAKRTDYASMWESL